MAHDDDAKLKLLDALRTFETVMVITHGPDGNLHARPMAVAAVDATGEVWFVTTRESAKAGEAIADPRVTVTGQSPGLYLAIAGELDTIHDPARIQALWRPSWSVWFPQGKADESLLLLRLRPAVGEYWDERGLGGLRYLFEVAKARLAGETPRDDVLPHARIPLP